MCFLMMAARFIAALRPPEPGAAHIVRPCRTCCSDPVRSVAKRRRQRGAVWVILDSGREISTGAGESDISAAEEALANHIGQKHRPDFGQGHPSRVLIADALSEYGEKHAPTTRRPDLIGGAIGKLIDFYGAPSSRVSNQFVVRGIRALAGESNRCTEC